MSHPFVAGVGGVVSADIAVPEHERELAFYARVLTTGDAPRWRDDLMNDRGVPIIGLGARTPEYESIPLQWMPHIQVAEVSAAADRAVELGGHDLMRGACDGGDAPWAVLVDPAGAAFGVIAPVGEDAVPQTEGERFGRIASLSLVVPDVGAAGAFYEAVAGWSPAASDIDGACVMQRPDGGASATILPASGDHAGVPPVWILGLPVDDLAQSLQLARDGGGEVVAGSAEVGHAVIRDPVGVCIGLQADG